MALENPFKVVRARAAQSELLTIAAPSSVHFALSKDIAVVHLAVPELWLQQRRLKLLTQAVQPRRAVINISAVVEIAHTELQPGSAAH